MVLVSALIVILSGVVVIGGIAGAFLCKSNLLRMVLLCLSFVGSLAVLVAIIWMLKESALQGDWRNDRRYDRNVVCFSCGVSPLSLERSLS